MAHVKNFRPAISVILLNYNGARWIERCLVSLKAQTILSQIEVIVADNISTDGSDKLAEQIVKDWPNAKFIQHGVNGGCAQGNNKAIVHATGEYLFILNNDAWLEADCLEIILRTARETQAGAATPLVLNFDDDTFQSLGAEGFDIFGLASTKRPHRETREVFMPEGCSWLIKRELYDAVGGFDPNIFMVADEFDFSFRVWISGSKAVAIPTAHAHHRGAANVNPKGDAKIVEFRTSDMMRFYANRHGLLVVLKNAQHILLLMVFLQFGLLTAEALVGLMVVRRWSFVKRTYIDAIVDVWRLRRHIQTERRRIQQFRKRSDWWMLRFLCWRMNRFDELKRVWRYGLPKVTPWHGRSSQK